jgi:dihydrofolate reductase
MSKVVIDMTMSLDGFVAGPEDGPEYPLGKNDGNRFFDWYSSGQESYRHKLFKPEPGANLDQVKLMYAESGAFVFGRRTYEITHGWGGAHPVNGVPVFVLTHTPPPENTVPKGPSNLTFVTDGIASAIRQAREVAGERDIKLGGASPGQQALKAGLCDESSFIWHPASWATACGRWITWVDRCISRSSQPPTALWRPTVDIVC